MFMVVMDYAPCLVVLVLLVHSLQCRKGTNCRRDSPVVYFAVCDNQHQTMHGRLAMLSRCRPALGCGALD